MRVHASSRTAALLLLGSIAIYLLLSGTILAQQQQTLGSVMGHVRVARGEAPAERVMVTLEIRGAAMDSVYTDSQGTFGFHNLAPNSYYVTVNDEHYQSVRTSAVISPTSLNPVIFVDVTLVPKSHTKEDSAYSQRPQGGNPNLMDGREFTAKFPKPERKEFEKGVEADRAG